MIYREGLVACEKINNRKCKGIPVTCPRYTFPGSPDPWKPGWPATRLPLVCDVNVIAFCWYDRSFTTNAVWVRQKGQAVIALYSAIIQTPKNSLWCVTGYFCPTVKFVASEREGMKRRIKFFKSDCFRLLHFSRNHKPHSALWLVDVLNYFNYLMVPPYAAHRIVS